MTAAPVAGDERVDEAPHLPLGGRRGRRLRPPRRRCVAPAPCSSASFSSSRRSRCWRSPTAATSACAAAPSSVMPSRVASPTTQRGRSRAFMADSTTTSPPAASTAAASFGDALARPSSRAKKATVVSGAIAGQGGHEVRLDLLLLEALGAVDDEEPPPHGEGHRAQRQRDLLGGRGVALEDLDAAGPGLALGQRAQAAAALGQAAVVVAVEQVGRLEGRHAAESRRPAWTRIPPAGAARRRRSPRGRSGGRPRRRRAGRRASPAPGARRGCARPPRRPPPAGAAAPGARAGPGPPSRGG